MQNKFRLESWQEKVISLSLLLQYYLSYYFVLICLITPKSIKTKREKTLVVLLTVGFLHNIKKQVINRY